jgi:hypothetical protein
MVGLLNALESEAMDTIRYCSEEIGFYLKEKEACGDSETVQLIDYFLWLYRYKIEANHDDITRWRSYKELS